MKWDNSSGIREQGLAELRLSWGKYLCGALEDGLDADAAEEFLNTDELHDEVWASYGDTIRKMGIYSIPLFIFNSEPDGGPFRREAGRTLTHNGSGSPQEFLALFEKAWAAQQQEGL